MRGLPRITIVTPSFNQGAFIENTIRSVLEQDYPDLEYIVMDGGSTDQTLDILKKYGKHLRWTSEPDRGQSHALNKAFSLASGDVLAFINTDDVYAPGALEVVGRFFAERTSASWLTGRCRIIDAAGNEIRRGITAYKNAWLALGSSAVLPVVNFISQPATFWRREVFRVIGPFDETLRYAMDYDYWLRVSQRFPLHVVHRELASFRIHPTSKAGASASAQFEAGLGIARNHVRSKPLLALHRLHMTVTVDVYRRLQASDASRRD